MLTNLVRMLKKLLIAFALAPCLASAQTVNPLLVHSNAPIAFNKVNAAVIKEALSATITKCDAKIKAITAIPEGKQTVANTLMAFDDLSYDLGDLGGKIYLATATYVDDNTRNEANAQIEKLSSYGSDIYLNAPLYKAIKRFSTSAAAKNLNPAQQKFLRETVISFEINGMKLDDNGRKKLKTINDKIISYGTQFDKNIAEYKDSLTFTAQQIAGVPETNTTPWKRADGTYTVRVNGPNYISILENASNPDTRKAMYTRYNNRAYPANITVLDSLFYYRQQLAATLGFKTYAEYALVQKMAGKPAVVWQFLNNLRDKLSENLQPEINELSEIKHQMHPELDPNVYAWDAGYYSKKLLDSKYKLNTDEVKQYFEMNSTVTGMFNFYQKLLNIHISEVKGLPVWYSKVKSYELFMDGKKMGTFFLDLYPRPNKYTHFETANISLYHRTGNHEILPVGVLICNFPEGSATEPSIMEHGDVITMFHEFGHLIHFLLCHPVIASQNSFAVKGDFVEAPSQFMENFCWNYNCLKLFARNYKTGQVLPVELFNKMKKAQLFGITRQYIRQVYFGTIDFTYEDRYDEVKQKGVDQIEKDLYSMTKQPYPDTHFICNFGHLNSYGANYYGYLWSKVYAQDIFSVFEKNGVLNQTLGVKYRKTVLEKGATEQETTMLKNFLGRQPNSKAFLRSLGLK